jgi:PAP2 superfamily
MFAQLVSTYHLHPILDHFTIALLTFGIAAEILAAAAVLLFHNSARPGDRAADKTGDLAMKKMWIALAVLGAVLTVQAGPSYAAPVNQVVQWNRNLLVIVRTPGAQPATIHSTHSFAIMHAAIYDAVNAIDGGHKPYLVHLTGVSPNASQDAAAAQAAHDVLVGLYPTFQATFDNELQDSLAQIPDGTEKTDGISIGANVAGQILSKRSNDGSNALPIPYVFGNAPGDYQSTPPNNPKQPQFTHWSHVTPFALDRADQFRPGPPPALTSETYTDDFNEVKSLGIANGTAATADQMLTGHFWNGAIQNYWNEITQTATIDHNLTTAQSARLFALLNLTLADSVIAFYDAKYTYNFWRPVTAIRAADTDNNPDTNADPNWLPEVGNTTPDPSYPGAHAVISAAGAEVLDSFFKRHGNFDFSVTSEVMAGTVRSFNSFSAAAEEATMSRIFAGVHFRSDLTTGHELGSDVADFVVDNFLTREKD